MRKNPHTYTLTAWIIGHIYLKRCGLRYVAKFQIPKIYIKKYENLSNLKLRK